jgi:hypothetical protein
MGTLEQPALVRMRYGALREHLGESGLDAARKSMPLACWTPPRTRDQPERPDAFQRVEVVGPRAAELLDIGLRGGEHHGTDCGAYQTVCMLERDARIALGGLEFAKGERSAVGAEPELLGVTLRGHRGIDQGGVVCRHIAASAGDSPSAGRVGGHLGGLFGSALGRVRVGDELPDALGGGLGVAERSLGKGPCGVGAAQLLTRSGQVNASRCALPAVELDRVRGWGKQLVKYVEHGS